MLQWFGENLATIVICLVLLAVIALVLIKMVKNKKQGKSSCGCMCHSSGFMRFIWKIVRFFYKIFGKNKVCACIVTHY